MQRLLVQVVVLFAAFEAMILSPERSGELPQKAE
jgi:hypothetical protein